MKIKKASLTLGLFILFISFIGLLSTKVFADSFDLSGTVTTSTGSTVSGATVAVNNVGTTTSVANTTTDSSGNYTVIVPAGIYDIQITPPSGSGFAPIIAPSKTISANTEINFVFAPAGSVTLSGQVYDPLGNALPDQTVSLQASGGTNTTTTTNSSGNYSLQVSSGTYSLQVSADSNSLSVNAPQYYRIDVGDYSLSQSTVLDITIPAKEVTMHVQDQSGNPVNNIEVEVPFQFYANTGTLSIGGGITNGLGTSAYGYNDSSIPQTDASGDVTLWLLPNSGAYTYSISATPQNGSIYNSFTVNDIAVTEDQTQLISLQYSHDAPETTIELSPTPNVDDTYSDPVTATLAATTDDGYTIANTYYKLDGGEQQTYSSPFTVSGEGEHTIEYWSVDNVGVIESKKTETFTIAAGSTTAQILVSPSSATVQVDQSFTIDVKVSGGGETFNAAQATVSVSSNLAVTSLSAPDSNACNFFYTKTPTTSNPSFAGGIINTSSNECNVYKLTLTPVAVGTGTITITNASIKSYEDNSEILEEVGNGSYTITSTSPTPTPTTVLQQLTIDDYVVQTYSSSMDITGTKESSITQIFVNDSDANSTYPTATTWQATLSLALGTNSFIIYGEDSLGNQTATQSIAINKHTLGDINGDGIVDLIDASLFAIDWNKTEDLTYNLSDMNGDNVVNLTDLSILAKLAGV